MSIIAGNNIQKAQSFTSNGQLCRTQEKKTWEGTGNGKPFKHRYTPYL